MKKKVLCILYLPPPVHGAAVVGSNIQNSELINTTFKTKYINMSASATLTDIGSFSFYKIYRYVRLVTNVLFNLFFFRPDICYITPTIKGIAFYKDSLLIMLCKVFRCRVVLHLHNKGIKNPLGIFEKTFYKRVLKNTNLILLSSRLYSELSDFVDMSHVFICYNGMPVKEIDPINREVGEVVRILFLSNMMKEKGVFDLLEACKVLKESGLNFSCRFIGKWSDISEETFNERVTDLKLKENVIYSGALYGDDKDLYLKESDIFVFPTFYHNETFGLVLLEAMQFALPLIATDEGGISDVVKDEYNGYIVAKNNIDALAEKIMDLIQNPDKRKLFGENGNKLFVEKFTLDIFEKRITEIFNKVLYIYK